MIMILQKFSIAALLVAALLMNTHSASAQHSDVEFGYEAGKIEVEFGPEGRVFEGEFETDPNSVDLQRTSEPGFESEPPEFGNLNDGDEIVYNVHGPLQFWNGTSLAPVAAGTQIRISNKPPAPTVPDTVISGTSGSQPGVFSTPNPALTRNRIGAADPNGHFHSDLNWLLEPHPGSPATGAYAVLISLSTDEPGIADSDRFFIVQNFGLSEMEFEEGVEAFAALIPEPSSMMTVGVGILLLVIFWK